ncbi:hypothetical protein RhiJN_20324 [Ceratobasidium sp. AG-Ba]|nr:hypothetical protein RhiJN_20324 [Ceratobasidium sp. AG-Ba]
MLGGRAEAADPALKPPAPPAEGQRPNAGPHKKTRCGQQRLWKKSADHKDLRSKGRQLQEEERGRSGERRPSRDADAEAGPVASPLHLFPVPLSALLPASPSGEFLVVPASTMLRLVSASMLGSAVPFANPSTVSFMSPSAVPHTAPLTAGLTDYRDC